MSIPHRPASARGEAALAAVQAGLRFTEVQRHGYLDYLRDPMALVRPDLAKRDMAR